MSKKKLLLIIISAVVLVAVCASIGLSGMLSPYERQIRLAYKYLEQGNYEEAILAFDKAIEIDVKRDKAYIGKADVYIARCDENTLEDVKAVLEIAYNYHYNDDNVVNAFIRFSDELMNKGYSEWATDLLDFGYRLTQNIKIMNHREALIVLHLNHLPEDEKLFVHNLYSACKSYNYKKVHDYLLSSEEGITEFCYNNKIADIPILYDGTEFNVLSQDAEGLVIYDGVISYGTYKNCKPVGDCIILSTLLSSKRPYDDMVVTRGNFVEGSLNGSGKNSIIYNFDPYNAKEFICDNWVNGVAVGDVKEYIFVDSDNASIFEYTTDEEGNIVFDDRFTKLEKIETGFLEYQLRATNGDSVNGYVAMLNGNRRENSVTTDWNMWWIKD